MIEINMNLVYTIINVIILYLLLRHFLIKPVTDIMEKRKQLIADGLQSAQDAQDGALKMKQEYEAALNGAKQESVQIVENARKSAKAEYDRILEEAGEDVGRLEYRFVERGGTKDAARQLGLCEHDIVKSLVFDDGKGGQAVMALMHGDERVSLHKLQRLSGVPHLQPSSPENAERLTGYKPGGICPFGLPLPLPVFAQISLFNLGMLYINAGERGVIAVIRPEALRLSGAVAGDILSGGSRR